MKNTSIEIEETNTIDRTKVFEIIQAGLRTGEIHFAKTLSESWLDNFPGDLGLKVLLSRALYRENKFDQSIELLQEVVRYDPQFLAAYNLLTQVGSRTSFPGIQDARGAIHALGGTSAGGVDIPSWAVALKNAGGNIQNKEYKKAEGQIQSALASGPNTPLPSIMHTIVARESFEWRALKNLIELYRLDWPDALFFKIVEADILMDMGEEQAAVSLLHECSSADIRGQVISRLLGRAHKYADLWTSELQIPFDFQIPAAVASELGWNNLAGGKTVASTQEYSEPEKPTTKPKNKFGIFARSKQKNSAPVESLLSIKREFLKVAERLSQSQLSRADGRFPVYVILTSQHNLIKKYGQVGFEAILKQLESLKTSTEALPNWNAVLSIVDDADNAQGFGLTPVKPNDPWAIKNYLVDLDEALKKNGQMIAALLIVGSDDIIPFHRLPNPVDDLDADVPSDNPYSTIDEDYFIPSWSTGRLPDGIDSDPKYLVNNLKRIIKTRLKANNGKSFVNSIPMKFIMRILNMLGIKRNAYKTNFGYSAQIWQRASHSVFRIIGNRKALSVSPPAFAEQLPEMAQKKLDLAYFNLHGLEDSAEWYGQRDPMESNSGPDYPIAMRPQDVVNSGRAPQVVFTEACYGANVINKSVDNALSLKFLSAGSKAVIGSTSTSYGSIATPLIAADLLGQSFWKLLKEGFPVGESLRRAKIYLAREMHSRQGYLDGEDQKTLLQFVLYGDPLAQPDNQNTHPASYQRYENPSVKTICDKANGHQVPQSEIPAEVISQVKGIVKSYLPGMSQSKITYTQEHIDCVGHHCPNQQMGQRANPKSLPRRKVITLSKQVAYKSNNHPHYARVTFDEQGKVVKLAVSR